MRRQDQLTRRIQDKLAKPMKRMKQGKKAEVVPIRTKEAVA